MFSHMSSAETQPPQPPRRNRSRRRRNRGKRAEEEEDEGSPTWHREGLIFFGGGVESCLSHFLARHLRVWFPVEAVTRFDALQ